MGDLAEICLGGLLHLGEYHGADFLGSGEKIVSVCREIQTAATSTMYKFLEIMFVLDLDGRLSALADNFEWPMFEIPLDVCIIEVATNQT